MISPLLKFFLSIALILYFILIIMFLRKKSLSLKYTLLWIFAGIFMVLLVIFPQILNWIVHITNIKLPINGLFVVLISFIIIILMSITSIVSKQSEKIKTLV